MWYKWRINTEERSREAQEDSYAAVQESNQLRQGWDSRFKKKVLKKEQTRKEGQKEKLLTMKEIISKGLQKRITNLET